MKHERLIWIILTLLVVLGVASLAVALFKGPGSYSYPYAQTAQVDYGKISQIIDQKLAQLPKAQPAPAGANGDNGLNGNPGLIGSSGTSGSQGIQGAQGPQGMQGPQGPQGDTGQPGPSVDIRVNALTGNLEWQHDGDLSWQILELKCQLEGICE